MKDYPRLTEMGVLHPKQITYFSVSSLDQTDYLRIVYERPRGSLLPTSRIYEFPRVQEGSDVQDGADAPGMVMVSSPAFREAVAELERILSVKESKQDLAETMLKQVRQLEEEVSMHTEYLKYLVEKIRNV
ncbi:MAG: DUF3461 family protein [Gammaproteobacteria bacterium]|nr:DUF3461 family protein [Gammaproteobacteria bacterium]